MQVTNGELFMLVLLMTTPSIILTFVIFMLKWQSRRGGIPYEHIAIPSPSPIARLEDDDILALSSPSLNYLRE